MSVLVIGEALIDEVHGPAGNNRSVGGSPINVAVALGRLGTPATLLTHIGNDSDGDWIREHANSAGVHLTGLPSGETSIASARLQEDGSATYDFKIRWDPRLEQLPEPHTVIHTGSLAIFLDPGARLVADLLQRDPLAIVTLDPNIRPGIIGHHTRAVHRFETIAALTDIIKLSDEDAAWLYPDVAFEDIPNKITCLGPSLVVVTAGDRGATLTSTRGSQHIPGIKVPVADTIGAGDTFMGALLHQLIEARINRTELNLGLTDEHLKLLGHFAVRAAAINVSRTGANPPSAEEMRGIAVH